jgi:hypothetical protein
VRRCGYEDRVADEDTMMAHLLLVGAHRADVLCRATLWS